MDLTMDHYYCTSNFEQFNSKDNFKLIAWKLRENLPMEYNILPH